MTELHGARSGRQVDGATLTARATARSVVGVSALWGVSVTVALLGVGCGKPVTESECMRMLDHYTELLIRSDRPNTKAAVRDKLKAEARAKASRDPEFARCTEEVSRRQLECALNAHDVDMIERCLL